MRLGRYDVTPLHLGHFALDGGAMFGVVPKALWQQELPADAQNRVRLALRTLLLTAVDGSERILVDTGMGEKWSARHREIFAVEQPRSLAAALAEHGLRPGDITDVLLTHLHFDHAGGATVRRGEAVVPAFERARYHVQRRNLVWAKAPSERDRGSYRAENFAPLEQHGVLELLDGPGEWREGIELVLSEGHTTAMQLPLLHGPEGRLLYCADLIPTAAHLRLPWVMSYDNQPIVTVAEKRALLARGVAEGWIFAFEHDPTGPAARLRAGEQGFEVAARLEL